MYSIIAHNADVLLSDRKLEAGVRAYASLRDGLWATDVSKDLRYQQLYRRFWALNAARWKPDELARYFQLLERAKESCPDMPEVVQALARGGGANPSLEFSFASKLVHMVRPEAPVYDSLVAAFYLYLPPTYTRDFAGRLHNLLGFYAFLGREYSRAVAAGVLSDAIAAFRAKYPAASRFTDGKLIDFLIWTYVRMMRGGALLSGRIVVA